MLEIVTPEDEIYIPRFNKFINVPSCVLTLEHSLISVAKWESKWHIPYLSNIERSTFQELDYIRCMTVNTIKNEYVYEILSEENIRQIKNYIEEPMTAAKFSKTGKNNFKKETLTAETIYCRMFANNIPLDCQKWHLNRLLALLRACDIYNTPKKKMSKQETAQWNSQQNALRRAKYNSKG